MELDDIWFGDIRVPWNYMEPCVMWNGTLLIPWNNEVARSNMIKFRGTLWKFAIDDIWFADTIDMEMMG